MQNAVFQTFSSEATASAEVPRLGIYVHVPYCAARCGYCDFNTYVPDGPGRSGEFLAAARAEIALARRSLGARTVSTIFVGGGTPTLLGAAVLLELIGAVRENFALATDVEITIEANPESTDEPLLDALRGAGVTRISIGMQSAAAHVLATLERSHSPGRAVAVARAARTAGFRHVSLDLIYGTPGESDADWRASVEAAVSAQPDHVSAYALTVEPGTRLAAAVRSGRVPAPDDAAQARRFHLADQLLSAAGLHWYEISSWARDEDSRCQHNVGYWRSDDWWGIGPGAHSHVAGRRWSNVKRPATYAARLAEGRSPLAEQEVLSAEQRALEGLMLGLRTREGIAEADVDADARPALEAELASGRLLREHGRLRLSSDGRLFADAVVRALAA